MMRICVEKYISNKIFGRTLYIYIFGSSIGLQAVLNSFVAECDICFSFYIFYLAYMLFSRLELNSL